MFFLIAVVFLPHNHNVCTTMCIKQAVGTARSLYILIWLTFHFTVRAAHHESCWKAQTVD